MATSEVFHFEEFTLEVQEWRLLRGAEVVCLSPKAYDMLVALVQQRGRLVTKEDLLKRLWPVAKRLAQRRTLHFVIFASHSFRPPNH